MQTQFVDAGGARIAVREEGSGPPIVFVHGAGGDGHNWDRVVERLRDRFRCVVVDRAGYGESVAPPGDPPSRADHGDHLRAVVEAAAARGGLAVGTSGGALTVIAALRRDATLFGGVVLIEPPLHVVREGADGGGSEASRPAAPAGAGGGEGDLAERGAASLRRLDAAAWDSIGPEDRQRYVRSFETMFRETSRGPYEVPETELAAMTVQALVVYGSRTLESFISMSRDLAAALPNATLREVEGGAHLMYITCPDEVATVVADFAEGTGSPP